QHRRRAPPAAPRNAPPRAPPAGVVDRDLRGVQPRPQRSAPAGAPSAARRAHAVAAGPARGTTERHRRRRRKAGRRHARGGAMNKMNNKGQAIDPRADPDVPQGMSIELLQDLHLLTRDGKLNADARRKLKQIRHLVGLLRPVLDDAFAAHETPVIVDCGAGKSYLGFLLYELVLG